MRKYKVEIDHEVASAIAALCYDNDEAAYYAMRTACLQGAMTLLNEVEEGRTFMNWEGRGLARSLLNEAYDTIFQEAPYQRTLLKELDLQQVPF